MEVKHKITIPKPCHVDWNKMTPDKTGRFCNSCSKSVVDFTQMLPKEIQKFFIKNQGKKICGRFQNKQLDSIIIQIPNRALFSQVHYHKMFLLALFITMGTTLFSCKQENGDKQKIDKIEVVKDSSKVDKIYVGDIKASKMDSTYIPPPPPPPKADQVKFVKPPKNDPLIHAVTTEVIEIEAKPKKQMETEIVTTQDAIETIAEYNGGMESFKNFIKNNYQFPKNYIPKKGEIEASFIIERDGSLSSIKITKELQNETGKELARILNTSEKWKPGTQNGKLVRTKQYIRLFIKTDAISKIDSIDIHL